MAVLPAQPEATSAMRAAPHPLPEIGAKRRVAPGRVLAVAAAGAGLAFVDATIVNVAFPDMQADFAGTSLGALSWILNAYNIVFAAFLVAAGRLADLAGRRRTFHAGIVLFTVASAACAAAPSVELLVAARVFQALGAAITVPASLALVLEAYPPAERAHGVALWTAAAALAAGLGPSLGGALVELGGWRLAFLVNVPLGIVALAAGRRVLVESRAPGRRTLPDLRGAGLAALAIGMLTLGIVQGEEWGWTSPGVLAAFGAALGCGVVFVRRCRWHRAPMLDLDLLRIRPLSVANVLSVVAAAGFYAYVLNNVLFLTGAWGYSVLDAGLALSVGPFVAAAVARPASRLAGRLGYRPMLLLGGLVWAAGLVYMQTRVGLRPAFVREWLPGMLLLGVGAGLTFPLLSSAAVASAPGERFATATSLSSVSRQVGAVLGVSLLIVVVGTPDPAEVAAAFDRGWTFSAVCMLVVGVGALALGRIAPAATADAPSASFVGPVPPAAAPARKAPEWPSPTAPLRPGDPATIAVAGLQSGLPLDVVCHALERKLGRTVLRLDSEQLWSDDGRRQLERAGRVLAVTAGGPVPFRLQGRPDLHGSDVLLVDGPTGTRGFGLWLDVLQARARHVAVGAGFDAAIGRVARRMSGHSVGLVLSGGGARALAHIGVVEELLAAGIEIDRVGGTSMGAFLGALLAMGHDPEEIEACCYEQWVRRSPLTDYRLPRVSLLRGARARAMIDRTFPGNIEALPLDFFCVTCDLVAGDMVVHRRGSLAKAVGASISIPGLVPPMARHGRLLVDGGVLNNLPVDVMATAHEGPIIAVDVTSRVAPPADDDAEPSLHETLVRTLTLGSIDTTAAARRHADLVIRPVDQGAGILEFHQLDRLRAEGRRAARAALRDAPERLFVSTEAAARRAGHAG